MKKIKKLLKWMGISVGVLFLLFVGLVIYVATDEEQMAQAKIEYEQKEKEKEIEKQKEKELEKERLEEEKKKKEEEKKLIEEKQKIADEKKKVEEEKLKKEEEKVKVEKEKKIAAEESKKAEEEKIKKEKELKEKKEQEFESKMQEIEDSAQGAIVAMRPAFEKGDYKNMEVVVSDGWYYTQEHIKQRFVDVLYTSLSSTLKDYKKIKSDDTMFLDVVDAYGKTVAHYSVWSGMVIDK